MDIRAIAAAYDPKVYGPTRTVRSEGKAAGEKPKTQKKDSNELVQISESSRESMRISEAVSKLPEVRISKVEEIKARIQNNDYPITNELLDDVARNLMEKDVVSSSMIA